MHHMIARMPLPALAVVAASLFATLPASGRAQAAAPAAPAASSPIARLLTEPPMVQEAPVDEAKVPEPKIEHLVSEDSQVRIEETRVRGVPTKIVVKSKLRGMGSYGIQPRDPGRYPQDDYSAGLPSLNFGF
jgi:hypothetical protein